MSDLLLVFLTVPPVAAFVGWITNWAAVKMIFHPQRFVGLGPIGWQGVLPRRARKFARGVAETITTKLISPREMAERLDPAELERAFAGTLDREVEAFVGHAAEMVRPGGWEALPPPVRSTIVDQVRARARQVVRDVFDRLQGLSDELLDLRALIVSSLSGDNTGKLVRLFQEIGAKELRFIVIYGGVFGLIIGIAQAGLWGVFRTWWLMPIVGVIVGLVTNWLAIQMIFRPQEPMRYLGLVTYQGLFPKRQLEIAADYGRITADEVLTPRNLLRLVTEGEAGVRIARVVGETVSERLEREWRQVGPMLPVEVPPETLERIKQEILGRLLQAAPEVRPELEAYLERKLDIARTVEGKLASLSKPEFERILRGIFEEDEVILIVIGGVLGGAIGLLQGFLALAIQG
jgi:uncharacterized membrane protein YheB (UPF0754 family)